ADPDTLQVTADPRYERIRGEYRMLVREELICSTQVHVGVPGRDLAVAVGRRVAPWLPALLAVSASSPFWPGTDTGYASYRTLIWRRWPTAGALPGFASAAEYDRAVADLVRGHLRCGDDLLRRPALGAPAHPGTADLRLLPRGGGRAAAGRAAGRAGRGRGGGAGPGARQLGRGAGRLGGTAARGPGQRRPPRRRRHADRRDPRCPAMAAGRTAGRVTPGAPMALPNRH